MKTETWQELQRVHYEHRPHRHLLPSAGGLYAENLVDKLWEALAISHGHGVEVGCGAGRFTIPLLERCDALEAIDLSRRQLDVLAGELERRGIDSNRCGLHEASIENADGILPAARYDFVAGFFILHHFLDPEATVARLTRLLRPGGRIAFLEPNRWNPLFLLQIACCQDMTWKEERGLYRLGTGRLRRIFTRSGLTDWRVRRLGFFPPQIINRFPWALRLEHSIERWRWLDAALPFLLVSGTNPAS